MSHMIRSLAVAGMALALMYAAPRAHADDETASFESPVLITDVGQGNNARLLQAMLRRSDHLEIRFDELAGADKLEGVRTLLIGVGASTKGLGAAGLDVSQEMSRTEALISAARERGIAVIGAHIGGEARRGELSDRFNEYVARHSDVFIVWTDGDADGFFTRLAEEHGLDLRTVERRLGIGAEIEALFAR